MTVLVEHRVTCAGQVRNSRNEPVREIYNTTSTLLPVDPLFLYRTAFMSQRPFFCFERVWAFVGCSRSGLDSCSGAEVIKIENPQYGDDTRTWGPPWAENKVPTDKSQPESAYFLSVNRNKKSVAVNIKNPSGVALICDLARRSDVLVENYIPGKLDEMGLGYEELSRINPRLIYTSITGYGPQGPYAQRAGYDVMIEAEAGLMHITGEKDGRPVKVGVAITDCNTYILLPNPDLTT
ncbi:CoA-transferase family III domain-containing protein, partial [Jimgerdemannia flammicorona]